MPLGFGDVRVSDTSAGVFEFSSCSTGEKHDVTCFSVRLSVSL